MFLWLLRPSTSKTKLPNAFGPGARAVSRGSRSRRGRRVPCALEQRPGGLGGWGITVGMGMGSFALVFLLLFKFLDVFLPCMCFFGGWQRIIYIYTHNYIYIHIQIYLLKKSKTHTELV